MAAWFEWQSLQIATSHSVGQTVLETIWPEVRRVALAQHWKNWQDVLLSAVTGVIRDIKESETPSLVGDDNMRSAISAGEMWASSEYHVGVKRFDSVNVARAWIMAHVHVTEPSANIAAKIMAELKASPAGNHYADENPTPWAQITFDHFIIVLYIKNKDMDCSTEVLQNLVTYIAGMSKMGAMTQDWRRSRIAQIRKEAGNFDIELENQVASKIWDIYGSAYGPAADRFKDYFRHLYNMCKDRNLTRLYVTAQQSAAQGCTVLKIVQDSMILCPDFNWNRIIRFPKTAGDRVLHSEFELWHADFKAMVKNPWIRFGGAVGRGPQMANLGYLAKQLLTRARGVMSLTNYGGLDSGNQTISQRVYVDRLVRKYVDELMKEMDDKDLKVTGGKSRHLPPGITYEPSFTEIGLTDEQLALPELPEEIEAAMQPEPAPQEQNAPGQNQDNAGNNPPPPPNNAA